MYSRLKAYAKGLSTHAPFLRKFISHQQQFYGEKTKEAPSIYEYSVWLRHMVMLHSLGLPTEFEHVVEIGPGDSLGVGHMALLTGSKKYTAIDILDRTRSFK